MDHSSFEISQGAEASTIFPLPSQALHFDGIDFAARLYRLQHHRVARSHAGFTRMLFDLRHVDPFRPPKETWQKRQRIYLPARAGRCGSQEKTRDVSDRVSDSGPWLRSCPLEIHGTARKSQAGGLPANNTREPCDHASSLQSLSRQTGRSALCGRL
jgi:hypothetical protein